MDYLDFDLEITRLSPGQYRAGARSPIAGEGATEFAQPFSEIELENFILKIGRTRTGTRRLNSPQMMAAEAFGKRLFETVFQGTVRDCLTASLHQLDTQAYRGLRIRLRLVDAPELSNLPWEYLYHPTLRQFVVLSTQTPLIRYIDLPRPVRPLAVTPPLRLLVMVSDPKDYPRLDVKGEKTKIAKAVEELEKRGVLKVEWLETATLAELQRRLRKPDPVHIFHFIGHGGWNAEKDDGFLLFTDDYGDGRKVAASSLATILGDYKLLRLVVLNACEGARGSTTDPFAGTAATLVNLGLPAVLAMQFEISDRAAIQLAQIFYESLADGYPVEAALAEARKMIFADGNDVEWGTPVLYMRAKDGVLFDLSALPIPVMPSQLPKVEPLKEPAIVVEPPTPKPNPDRLTINSPFHFELIRIPAGEFLMGSDKSQDPDAYDHELPQHRVYVSEFYMGRYPITKAQYVAFKKIKIPSGEENHPAVNVSWNDAQAFCQWLSEKTGKAFRLPTEAEWEKAARAADGRIYPWGNEWDESKLNSGESNGNGTTSVGKYSPAGDSPYGLADMSGNVWEWCADWFGEQEYQQRANANVLDPQGPASDEYRVLRGGSWDSTRRNCRAASRRRGVPARFSSFFGFRLALSP